MALKVKKALPDKVTTLASALADKGTPGIILLAIIFLTIWAPVALIIFKFLVS